ncbi:hypothetical protein ACP70R_004575 [Stipagrostis hirtigluma subsp. patula]
MSRTPVIGRKSRPPSARMAHQASARTPAPSRRASARALRVRVPPPRCCPLCAHAQAPSSWGWGAKRPRTQRPDAAVSWRDWAGLASGPAGLIAERALAGDVADYIRFRAACRGWRACADDPRAHGVLDRRFHPRQWIMLRETVAAPHRRRLLNVSTGECITMDLPELAGHDVFGSTTEGLLVLLDRTNYVVRVLNPITRQAADLPPATALLPSKVRDDPRQLLEVSGAGLADVSTFAVHFFMIETLAVVKPGQDHWTVVHRGNLVVTPAMSFAGRFYGVTKNKVMVVETSRDQPPRLALAAKLARAVSAMMVESVHLVDNDGELLLVDREQGGTMYEVYRVDLDTRKMVPVRGLGGRAVFISSEQALSVSPSVFPSIAADAVYLGFSSLLFPGNLVKSPYHLKDGTVEPRDFSYFGSDLFKGKLRKYLYYWLIDRTAEPPDQCGPWEVDDYLSSCITGFRDGSEDTIASSPTW